MWLVMVASIVTGCAQIESESNGDYHQAYELYCNQIAANPGNVTAGAGLRRTAPLAAAYWQRQAYAAADAEHWQEAAAYHKKVLEIKPDELSSILALRQIARFHADQVSLAYAAQPEPISPEPASELPQESPPSPQAPVLPEPAKPRQIKPTPVVTKPELAAVRPTLRPVPAVKPDPYKQKPSVIYNPSASTGEFIMVMRVSNKDHRYSKTAALQDGLAFKIKDTDKDPLDADVEILLQKKRIGKFKNLPEGSVIKVIGQFSRPYEIVVIDIYDRTQTVTVGLRRSQ
jgi:tetratricopeptide (TPR) repeat protein